MHVKGRFWKLVQVLCQQFMFLHQKHTVHCRLVAVACEIGYGMW